jgi:AcrR family transcriptional regulator
MAGVRQFDELEAFEKAIALFWRKGYAQTTMKDLAEVTGVQRGSLYNAYGNKDVLFLRAFQIYAERYLCRARQALEQSSLSDALHGFFEFIIGWLLEGDPARGCLSTKMVFGGEDVAVAIRQAVASFLDKLESVVQERLSYPGDSAALSLSPAMSARLVITVARGIVVLERVYSNDRQRLKASADALVTVLVRPEGPA